MKLTVITAKGGKIVGTAREAEKGKPEAGVGGPIAVAGQKVQVIDVPKELEGIVDVDEFHRQLKSYVGTTKRE